MRPPHRGDVDQAGEPRREVTGSRPDAHTRLVPSGVMPLNTDPNAMTDAEYWADFEDYKATHPEDVHPEIPPDTCETYPDPPGTRPAHLDHNHQQFPGGS